MVWDSGTTVNKGRYTIEEHLGDGRFSSTFLACHSKGKHQNPRLAIKTWRQFNDKDGAKSPEDIERLNRVLSQEATKLSRCNSPYIVGLIDEEFTETDRYGKKLVCLPLEYIPGIKIDKLSKSLLSEKQALRYIFQIANGLIEVHRQDLVHLDVKPDNIMIRQETNEAVLIGFDFSRQPARGLTPQTISYASHGFAAWEWYQREPVGVDERTDIYSLAATLYFLLTGEVPPSARDRRLGQVALFLRKHNKDISLSVKNAIYKGMELKPDRRPNTVKEWLDIFDPELIPDLGEGSETKIELSDKTHPKLEIEKPETVKPKVKKNYLRPDWLGALAAIAGTLITLAIGLGWISPASTPPVDPPQNEVIQNR